MALSVFALKVQDNLGAAFDFFVRACLDGGAPLASGEDGIGGRKSGPLN